MQSSASFNLKYPFFSIRSSSNFLCLFPWLSITSILPSVFSSITCFRRQCLCKMWPIQLTFLLITVVNICCDIWEISQIKTYYFDFYAFVEEGLMMTVFDQNMWHLKATVKCCVRRNSPYWFALFMLFISSLCSFCLVGFSTFGHISQSVSLNTLPMGHLTSIILWPVTDWVSEPYTNCTYATHSSQHNSLAVTLEHFVNCRNFSGFFSLNLWVNFL